MLKIRWQRSEIHFVLLESSIILSNVTYFFVPCYQKTLTVFCKVATKYIKIFCLFFKKCPELIRFIIIFQEIVRDYSGCRQTIVTSQLWVQEILIYTPSIPSPLKKQFEFVELLSNGIKLL